MTLEQLDLGIVVLGRWSALAVIFGGGYILATLAHELSHFLMAKVLGCPAALHIKPHLETEFVVAQERSKLVDRTIGLAPTLIGGTGGILWLLLFGLPTATPLSAIGVFLWFWFAAPSPDDLLGGRWEESRFQDMPPELRATVGCLLFLGAVAVHVAGVAVPTYSGLTVWLAAALALAGAVYLAAAGIADERATATSEVTADD